MLGRVVPVVVGLLGAGPAVAAGVLEMRAAGVQVYRCADADGRFAWRLVGPEAQLDSADGKVVVRHFAGPSWQAADGSTVVGEVVASGVAGLADAAGSVPWLVLRAASHSGTGLLDAVAYVVRSDTAGGAAPAAGCDPAHGAVEVRVPYTATYTFFGVN